MKQKTVTEERKKNFFLFNKFFLLSLKKMLVSHSVEGSNNKFPNNIIVNNRENYHEDVLGKGLQNNCKVITCTFEAIPSISTLLSHLPNQGNLI